MSAALDPDAFPLERAEVRGVEIAFVRVGIGGYPLLLIHGWPETKRIWWRNIGPLAEAGFEVIVPDLRGFGDSGLAGGGFYDLAAHSRDMQELLTGVLGHERCAAVGGDLGGGVAQDLSLRFPGLVERQVLFNTLLPRLREEYEAAGLTIEPGPAERQASDYFVRQGTEPEELLAELDSEERRLRYIAGFHGHRFWASPGAFDEDEVRFMAEPFTDPEKLLAGWANYGAAMRARPSSERPRFYERSAVPTLALYGPEDHVIWREFPRMCEVAFTELVGPFVVPGAGHFLQWERAELLNQALIYFLADLRQRGGSA
jgi:pimeloyl-ACP methyl ester carboxylesterase